MKNQLIRKDPDAGKDWRQEKGMTEDEMVGWHHWLDGHEFEQALGVGDGQGSLTCCSPCGHKKSDMTEGLNWIMIQCLQNAIKQNTIKQGVPVTQGIRMSPRCQPLPTRSPEECTYKQSHTCGHPCPSAFCRDCWPGTPSPHWDAERMHRTDGSWWFPSDLSLMCFY